MLAICSQEIVPISHTAKLGPVQPQLPQRRAFGVLAQMHATTMSHIGREGYASVDS